MTVAHSVHYAIVLAGLLGLALLLVPQFVESHRRHPVSTPERPRDEHEARLVLLRSQIAAGTLGRRTTKAHLAEQSTRAERAWASLWRPQPLSTTQRVILPLAVVASAAAAGVHAAVGPAHFRESLLFGTFFALAALGQLAWAGAASVHCTRALLRIGVVGNLAILVLWVVTRTVGLPGGLLPAPEAVGPWDLACAAWEVAVVVSCLAMLRRRHISSRLPAWPEWHIGVRAFVYVSVLLLAALSFSGAGA